jgi:hypothetical protein
VWVLVLTETFSWKPGEWGIPKIQPGYDRAYRFQSRTDPTGYLSKFVSYPIDSTNLYERTILNKEPRYEALETYNLRKVRVVKNNPWTLLQPDQGIAELEFDRKE